MSDFLRYCELLIGPLADWQGAGNSAQAVRIVADGSNDRLRVQFSSSKTLTGEPNKTEVTITGLSRETRQAIRSGLTRVQVLAGYSSRAGSAALVASGALTAAISQRAGADVQTRLVVMDGLGPMTRSAVAASFAGGTPLATLVRQIAATMPGIEVGQIKVAGSLPAKGLQLSGSGPSQLNKLADQYGFSWSIQNGVLQAISDREDSGGAFAFSSAQNLISCVPILNGPLQVQVGVEIAAKFDARMRPGDRMVVQSDIAPQLSGSYKATSVALSFDSHGPALLRAQSLRLF